MEEEGKKEKKDLDEKKIGEVLEAMVSGTIQVLIYSGGQDHTPVLREGGLCALPHVPQPTVLLSHPGIMSTPSW